MSRKFTFLLVCVVLGSLVASADENTDRLQKVQQHPSPAGTPAACQVNWSKSGPLSQKCADALVAQADQERQGNNCAAAMIDYDLAQTAAQNAGTAIIMSLKTGDARTECEKKLHPQAQTKPHPIAYGPQGQILNGHYTCYTSAAVIANGGAYGTTITSLGQRSGDVWIYDAHRYANGTYNYLGHYTLKGDQIVATDGPFKKNGVIAHFQMKGAFGRPTIFMGYDNGHGGTDGNQACTYDGK